jgi:ribonuclease P protein component
VIARSFPKERRLRRRREFLRVQGQGKKLHVRNFFVFVQRGPESTLAEGPRLGITVTRRVGNAVVRNRIKRFVREVFRVRRMELRRELNLVWVAKHSAAQVSHQDVDDDFSRLVGRLGRPVERMPQ